MPTLTPVRPATSDALLDAFLTYSAGLGHELYPAQEEAVLELFEGRHVVLSTPTGSGKSLVALALHLKSWSEGGRSFYTSPIKALVNEKFFALCDTFGPDAVGMMTGDASINRDAPIICCTAEILMNLVLREGDAARIDSVVMDEFHYYADRDRGVAWQVPLLELSRTQFLLMSATLGDTTAIETALEKRTGRKVTPVHNVTRPVPLEFEYRLTPQHETIAELVEKERAPIYLVHFTQRDATAAAQDLTSVNLLDKAAKEAIREAIGSFRFDSPFGKDLSKYVRHGVGVHHAGLLPKYRRLVERLAQKNLLKVICGTDTLGVGVNVPLRTVLFTQLCKYDGQKTAILTARDFHQIAGRAGRKGFDDKGWVLAQAPEHVIENLALAQKAAKGKKVVKKQPPEKGYVHFDDQTFAKLQTRAPEPLESRFQVTHAMVLSLLQRPEGYRAMLGLIGRSHEREYDRKRHVRRAAQLVRSLRKAGIVVVEPKFDAWPKVRRGSRLAIADGLQREFSLNQALSLWVVETIALLDKDALTWPLDILTLVESVLENPKIVLDAQIWRLKGEKIAELKSQGVEYDKRQEELEKITYPKPHADFVYQTFNAFADRHPWVSTENVRPKSIARELYERGTSFADYVRDYGLERSEGVLLRYLTDAWRTLQQTVPEEHRTDEFLDVLAFLRVAVTSVDASLLEEWERMRDPDAIVAIARHEPPPPRKRAADADLKAFYARIRQELHLVMHALSRADYEAAAAAIHDPTGRWTPDALEAAIAPFLEEQKGFDTTPRARGGKLTLIARQEGRVYTATQKLLSKSGDEDWFIDAVVDLTREPADDAPLIEIRDIRG